jgi:hypothetical protein
LRLGVEIRVLHFFVQIGKMMDLMEDTPLGKEVIHQGKALAGKASYGAPQPAAVRCKDTLLKNTLGAHIGIYAKI